jgi:hypothetical protein
MRTQELQIVADELLREVVAVADHRRPPECPAVTQRSPLVAFPGLWAAGDP